MHAFQSINNTSFINLLFTVFHIQKRKLLSHSCTHKNPSRIHHSSNGAVIKRMNLKSVIIVIRNFLKGENTMMLYYGKKKYLSSFLHTLDFLLQIYFSVASLLAKVRKLIKQM